MLSIVLSLTQRKRVKYTKIILSQKIVNFYIFEKCFMKKNRIMLFLLIMLLTMFTSITQVEAKWLGANFNTQSPSAKQTYQINRDSKRSFPVPIPATTSNQTKITRKIITTKRYVR